MTSKHANFAVLISFASLEMIGLSLFVVMGLLQSPLPSAREIFEPYVLENIAKFAGEFIGWTWLPAGVHAFLFAAASARWRWWRKPLMMVSSSFMLSLAVFIPHFLFVQKPWAGIPLYVFLVAVAGAPAGSAWIVYRCFLPVARRESHLPV